MAMKEIIKHNKKKWRKRLLISVPTEGWIRFEWAHHRYGQVIPINWEAAGFDLSYVAMGYSIEDAYNIIVKKAIELDVEWLITIEDDVLIPQDCFLRFSKYIEDGKIPIVSGLYFSKGNPSEPLLFRGRGNGCFKKWELGEIVWVDGLPMGCLLIHMSILKWCWDNSEKYRVPTGEEVSKVFETPRKVFMENGVFMRQEGTQDLFFFDRIMKEDVLRKTGWRGVARRKYPFLSDTKIFCRHIDRNTGRQYP